MIPELNFWDFFLYYNVLKANIMNLNELIEKLVKFRDENNAGDFTVLNNEIVCGVYCGEIQYVYHEPIKMEDKDLVFDKDNKCVIVCAQDNNRDC